MKAHLPALAAIILLAAAPAFADDLLDAVLWDGPSAFPAKTEPATAIPAPPSIPSTSQPSAPAAPSRDELQLRRELEEMRARTERLEAALKQAPPPEPAEPPKPDRPQYDRADWPKRVRLSLNGFAGDDVQALGGTGEIAFPVSDTPFDVAIRGYYRQDKPDTYYPVEGQKTVTGATVWGIWYPWRSAIVSPHAGVGVGYEHTTGHRIHHGIHGEHTDDENLEDNGPTLAGRAGATLTYKRFTLKGEFILTSETKSLLAEVGLRIWEHLVLNGIIERFDVDLFDAVTAFGGGITILF